MQLDKTTLSLFPTYPRDVGIPHRSVIHNQQEFQTFFDINNGIYDCYVALYDQTYTIDKLFFDLDYFKSLLIGKYLYYVWYEEIGLPVIPVLSGRKGVHLYIKTKKYKNENIDETKELMRKAAFGLLWLAVSHFPKEVDTSVLGDVRRITRIPGSKRPPKNENYCTYLPPDFYDFDSKNLKSFLHKPHYYDYKINKRPKLNIEEFADFNIQKYFPDIERLTFGSKHNTFTEFDNEGSVVAPWNLINYLKPLIRECLLHHIVRANPGHYVRLATTFELLQIFDVEQVVSLYKKIGWYDWNEDYTRYQVAKAVGNKPYSNKKLYSMFIHNYQCSCYHRSYLY